MTAPLHPHLRETAREIVENQLRDGVPIETRATLARLTQRGYSREQALDLIACVVVAELYAVLEQGQIYDEARFVKALRALPELPGQKSNDDHDPGVPIP